MLEKLSKETRGGSRSARRPGKPRAVEPAASTGRSNRRRGGAPWPIIAKLGSFAGGLLALIFAGIQVWPIVHPSPQPPQPMYAIFRGSLSYSRPERTEQFGRFLIGHHNQIIYLNIGFGMGGPDNLPEGPDSLLYDKQQPELIDGFDLTGTCSGVCDYVRVRFTTPQTAFTAHIIQRVLTYTQVQGYFVVEGIDTHMGWNAALRPIGRENVPNAGQGSP